MLVPYPSRGHYTEYPRILVTLFSTPLRGKKTRTISCECYETLCAEGVIPGENHLLLFVLGRYGQAVKEGYELISYVAALKRKNPWMVCGFGQLEHTIAAQAVKLGGHVRVGFENNHLLPDGSPAPDNAALVKLTLKLARLAGRSAGDKNFAESLHSLSS